MEEITIENCIAINTYHTGEAALRNFDKTISKHFFLFSMENKKGFKFFKILRRLPGSQKMGIKFSFASCSTRIQRLLNIIIQQFFIQISILLKILVKTKNFIAKT